MSTLSAAEVLAVWERGERLSGEARTCLLLSMAEPGCSPEQWSDRSIGERNARLLALRARLFGTKASGFAACPKCRERIEFDIDLSGMIQPATVAPESYTFESDGIKTRFRLPTGKNLAETSVCTTMKESFDSLVAACVMDVEQDGRKLSSASLPDGYCEALADFMATCDPHAETLLRVSCPDCSFCWDQSFQIGLFLWQELNWHARRLLGEVHELARAYGWSESEILSLSPRRRRAYLELSQS